MTITLTPLLLLGSKEENLGISLVVLKRNCSSYELDRRKLYRKKMCQLKNVKEKIKLENCHFTTPPKINDSSKSHQWSLIPLSKPLMEN